MIKITTMHLLSRYPSAACKRFLGFVLVLVENSEYNTGYDNHALTARLSWESCTPYAVVATKAVVAQATCFDAKLG